MSDLDGCLDGCELHDSTPEVPTADVLFGDEALGQLRCDQELARSVVKLRERETLLVERVAATTRGERLRAYAGLVNNILSGVGIVIPTTAYGDSASLFKAVTSLPLAIEAAHAKRRAREVARIAMLSDEGGFHVPERAEELRGLWEQAMCGEPRWSADFPSSAFRTGTASVRGPWPERVLLHKCMEPDEVPAWLDRLINLLSDERLAPELRAACGLGLLDWIHPFSDGNGHTGRLLMLAMLNARYSQLTLVCLAYELVANRAATIQQFKQLRERHSDAIGFCLGMFSQMEDAQERALDMLAFNLEHSES